MRASRRRIVEAGDEARRRLAGHQGGGDDGVGRGQVTVHDLPLAAQELLTHLACVASLAFAAFHLRQLDEPAAQRLDQSSMSLEQRDS